MRLKEEGVTLVSNESESVTSQTPVSTFYTEDHDVVLELRCFSIPRGRQYSKLSVPESGLTWEMCDEV